MREKRAEKEKMGLESYMYLGIWICSHVDMKARSPLGHMAM